MPSEIFIAVLQAVETVEHFCMNKMKEKKQKKKKPKHKLLTHQNFISQTLDLRSVVNYFAERKVLAVYSTCSLFFCLFWAQLLINIINKAILMNFSIRCAQKINCWNQKVTYTHIKRLSVWIDRSSKYSILTQKTVCFSDNISPV